MRKYPAIKNLPDGKNKGTMIPTSESDYQFLKSNDLRVEFEEIPQNGFFVVYVPVDKGIEISASDRNLEKAVKLCIEKVKEYL